MVSKPVIFPALSEKLHHSPGLRTCDFSNSLRETVAHAVAFLLCLALLFHVHHEGSFCLHQPAFPSLAGKSTLCCCTEDLKPQCQGPREAIVAIPGPVQGWGPSIREDAHLLTVCPCRCGPFLHGYSGREEPSDGEVLIGLCGPLLTFSPSLHLK